MSSTDVRRAAPLLVLACASALALAGCASTGGRKVADAGTSKAPPAANPLEQHKAVLSTQPEQLALAVHEGGVISPAQDAALAAFARGWRAAGSPSGVAVSAPANAQLHADPAPQARAVAARLAALGVPDQAIHVDSYDAGGAPDAPVLARYEALAAVGPECDDKWDNLVATKSNEVSKHFGCATARNFAAMLADPRDVIGPRAMTPADAGRRAVVLDKYRMGLTTSTAKDDQARGVVSQTSR